MVIKMDKKVLVLDIDGTLTNSQKEITERTREAIIQTQERGHIVILASGRPTPGMKRYAEELELEKYGGYLLSFNGAKIINYKTKEIVCHSNTIYILINLKKSLRIILFIIQIKS